MRLYDKQYDEAEPNWWKEMRDRMQEKTEYDYKTLIDNNEYAHEGRVVNYE